MAQVSVFGLGYVGCVSAACLAREGHDVIGVDVAQVKVDLINAGEATIVEDGIAELVAEMVKSHRLRATTSVAEAVRASDLSLVCVGTPSRPNGSLDLAYVERVCSQIGEELARKAAPGHVVVIRSTVLPGTIHELVIPALEQASGFKAGVHFQVCSNPEFLREGTSIKDFFDPPFTLIGADDPDTARRVGALYAGLGAPLHITAMRVAEMVKYACNSFHAVKVSFANEIGNISKALGVDSHEVMRIFVEDRKLNVSAAYLKPGFAFGGSCLPKDLRAVTHRARNEDVPTPLLSSVLDSNRHQVELALRMIQRSGRARVGILGLAFKAGTDDLRESPMVTLIEMLIGKGHEVSIYDQHVRRAQLVGANREYIEREIPHIWSLMRDTVDDVIAGAEVVVIGNGSPEFAHAVRHLDGSKRVVDLVRIFPDGVRPPSGYEGICW